MKRLLAALAWLGGSAGLAIPAASSFFKAYVPPLFPPIGFTVAPVGAAIILAVWLTSGAVKLRRAIVLIATGVVLISAYLLLLSAWTVVDPQTTDHRYQIGFRKWQPGLTDVGLSELQDHRDERVEDWMLNETAYSDDGPAKIWKEWTILTAGSALLAAYLLGFVSWAVGFALLAKQAVQSGAKI